MKRLLRFTLFLSVFISFSQTPIITGDTEISVLTIGQGDNALYDRFGHSAIRIKDSTNDLDIIFNYGYFDFNAPNFYLNFAKGKLQYKLVATYFSPFYSSYKQDKRWVKEQVLNLTNTQKQELCDYYWKKIKPENSGYLYDFFYENCATKILDDLEIILNKKLTYNYPTAEKKESFRSLINSNLNWNSWGSFGINIALGSVIDKTEPIEHYQFLPKYTFNALTYASIEKYSNKLPLIKKTNTLFNSPNLPHKITFITSPFFIFSLVSILILWITFKNYKNKKRSKGLDVSIFIITGSVGLVLLLLWLATNHTATANNYNLLWACPISLIGLLQLFKNNPKRWFLGYLKLLIIMLCLLTLHWCIGVQAFSYALIPLLIALAIRYVYLIYYFKNKITP